VNDQTNDEKKPKKKTVMFPHPKKKGPEATSPSNYPQSQNSD